MARAKKPKKPSDMSYQEATNELEGILAEIEDERVDLDLLSTRVARAAELIQYCRSRLDETQLQVRKILEEMSQEEGAQS